MAFEDDDPNAVTHPLEIQAVVNGLLEKRTLVRLDVPGKAVSIISTLLEIDKKANALILDNASDEELNGRLLSALSVRLQGQLDRVMIEFSGKLRPASQGGRPAFSMAIPQQIRRLQRREFFRMDIAATSPAACVVRDASLPSGEARFRMLDLSAGGVRLADPDNLLVTAVRGTIFDACSLDLADAGTVDISLRLLRNGQLTQENNRILHTSAFHFFNLPGNRQITIQQYVGALERAVMARRWGID